MPRSTHAPARKARKKRVLQLAHGYWGRRKNVWTVAKNAVEKGLQYAYIHRRQKKRDFRRLWITRINAAVRPHGLSYSRFMNQLKLQEVTLNRKMLADIAMHHPAAFAKLAQDSLAAATL